MSFDCTGPRVDPETGVEYCPIDGSDPTEEECALCGAELYEFLESRATLREEREASCSTD